MFRSSSSSTLFPYMTLFRSCGPIWSVVTQGAIVRIPWLRNSCVAAAPYSTSQVSIRSEEHTSELQSLRHLVCRLLLEKKKNREGGFEYGDACCINTVDRTDL